ncbi:MAG: hypothetical protein IJJ13_06070 [Lachnospiraceae bacterium]|nr:hypothetical protein [Lachnospiraceae bacterium]
MKEKKEKETLKEKLENLFDGDSSNSNNIFDRISDQMTSPRVDKMIGEMTEQIKEKNKTS